MAGNTLSNREFSFLALVVGVSVLLLSRALQGGGEPIYTSLALSGLAYASTHYLIIQTAPSFLKAGLKGTDLSKRVKKEIPECVGAICAIVYLLIVMIFIPFAFYQDIVAATSGGGNRDVVIQVEHVNQGRFLHWFPHNKASKPVPDFIVAVC